MKRREEIALEALASEFGWEVDKTISDLPDWKHCRIYRNGQLHTIDLECFGEPMPLREQFVYQTAKNDALQKAKMQIKN